jgi:hypothetical protein
MSFNKYKLRRNTAKAVIALPIAAILTSNMTNINTFKEIEGLNPQYSTVEVNTKEEDETAKLLIKQLEIAKAKFNSAKGFASYDAPKDILVASSKTSIVIAKAVSGNCLFTGFIPGQESKIVKDPTLSACTEESIDNLKTALRKQDQQIIDTAYQKAKMELESKAKTALYAYLGQLGQSYQGLSNILKLPKELVMEEKNQAKILSVSTGLCWEITLKSTVIEKVKSCSK